MNIIRNTSACSMRYEVRVPDKQSIVILSDDEWRAIEQLLEERGLTARDLEFAAGHFDPAAILDKAAVR